MFAHTPAAIVFWIVYIGWFALEMVRDRTKRPVDDAQKKDRGSGAVLVALLVLGIIVGFNAATIFPRATISSDRAAVFWLGIALMIAGIAFRGYAVRVLGRFFTFEVAIRPDHAVIDTGPYKYIRHPSYTGALMTLTGIGVALTNWVSLALVVAFGFAGYRYRIHIEEQALRESLGEPYIEYMKRTRRLIPFIY